MTGPEHYREAERLVKQAEGWADFDRWPMTSEQRIARQAADAAAAQVHATLAVAAATAEGAWQSLRVFPSGWAEAVLA